MSSYSSLPSTIVHTTGSHLLEPSTFLGRMARLCSAESISTNVLVTSDDLVNGIIGSADLQSQPLMRPLSTLALTLLVSRHPLVTLVFVDF